LVIHKDKDLAVGADPCETGNELFSKNMMQVYVVDLN
jgi:hypothetical protein